MDFKAFEVVGFPPDKGWLPQPPGGFVYVFFWVAGRVERPFYVGQTQRLSGRMHDYELATFKACTDFRVGEAVKYLQDKKKHEVIVRYRASTDPPEEEQSIIRELLLEGVRLLNSLPSYDYRGAEEAEQRDIVKRFCGLLIGSNTHKEADMRETFELISLDELSVLEIACEECGTIIALKTDGDRLFPVECPICRKRDSYSDRLVEVLRAYRNFYTGMKELGLKARFRVSRTPATDDYSATSA